MTVAKTDFPYIETARFAMRPLSGDDIQAVQEVTDDPQITRAIPVLSTPFDISDAEKLVLKRQDPRNLYIGAWDHSSSRLFGVVGVHLVGTDEIDIDCWVKCDLSGRGIATEAAGAILAALQIEYPHRRITAECPTQDAAPRRVLDKLGFRVTGENGQRIAGRQRLTV